MSLPVLGPKFRSDVPSDQLAGKRLSGETVEGSKVHIDGTNGVTAEGATVATADVMASKGVIHAIDAVPLFTGLKIGSVGVMAGAITGECLGGGNGFGELIRVAASQLNTPRVFSLILYLSFIGLALFAATAWAQRALIFWHRERH